MTEEVPLLHTSKYVILDNILQVVIVDFVLKDVLSRHPGVHSGRPSNIVSIIRGVGDEADSILNSGCGVSGRLINPESGRERAALRPPR